ncbi:BnaC06g00150D [Brassica napus]|uniref:BnaC06g00150D protein n=1 Tax=Brassica napus TaxID=3708 RepID=A0A078FWJ7_BRANA|nr:BnaC06g00150D [Brassica napus]
MTLVYLLFVSKLMQQKVTKDEKCVRNLATYEGLSLENESLGLVLENQVTTATFLSFNLAQLESSKRFFVST